MSPVSDVKDVYGSTPAHHYKPAHHTSLLVQTATQFTVRIGLPNFSNNVACALRGFWLPVGVLRT